MAQESGKGSILFKLLIALLAVVLILIIKIPASIWDEEKLEKTTSQYNMSSIYEAEKFYKRLHNKLTTDKDELLSAIQADSSLKKIQMLVDYTQQLKVEIDNYLNNEYVNALLTINQNISTIGSDLALNERYFKSDQNILNEADQLKVKLGVFSSDINFPNFSSLATYLDSLYQLRRDLSDYNLQTAASKSAYLTQQANSHLNDVEIKDFETEWASISARLIEFRKAVDDTRIRENTSVSARIQVFVEKTNSTTSELGLLNKSSAISDAQTTTKNLENLYQTFLRDYIVTSRTAQYTLEVEDSMVLFISDKDFYCPVSKEPYKLSIAPDSSDIKVESPILLEELRDMVKPIADKVSKMTFLNHYQTYLDTLQSIHKRGLAIKQELRRNIDITVKNKEIEEKINKYKNGSEYSAASNLREFVSMVYNSQSYSEIKESVENARNAIGIFEQVYGGNVFANIDSLNSGLIADIEEYNKILSEIRRLPRGVVKFEKEADELNQIVSQIKQPTANTKSEDLLPMQNELEEILLFAAEGKTVRVYGVFEKEISNFGYVFKNTKSWEEEE